MSVLAVIAPTEKSAVEKQWKTQRQLVTEKGGLRGSRPLCRWLGESVACPAGSSLWVLELLGSQRLTWAYLQPGKSSPELCSC